MNYELSKLLESALEEADATERIKHINAVFKIINDTLPNPTRFSELIKDTFLMKNLILCRPIHQKTVTLMISMFEDSLSYSKLFIINYAKSLCELVSMVSSDNELATSESTRKNLAVLSQDYLRVREMPIPQFKSEVKVAVRQINDSISFNLSEIKIFSLSKLEGLLNLMAKFGHHESEIFRSKFYPLVSKYFKGLFECTTDEHLIARGWAILQGLPAKVRGLSKFVNLNEMEDIVTQSDQKSQNLKKMDQVIKKLKEKNNEQRNQLQRKIRIRQFKDEVRKYGVVEASKNRLKNFLKICQFDSETKKMMNIAGNLYSDFRLRPRSLERVD